MIRIFFIIIFLVSTIFAFDKIYFLPDDGKKVSNEIEDYIKNAQESIDIAMYNISYRKFGDALNEVAKKGVKVKLFYYKKKLDLSDEITTVKIKDKLHTKIAIIDKKIVIFGSANWTKDSFKDNYEVISISDDSSKAEQFNNFIKTLR